MVLNGTAEGAQHCEAEPSFVKGVGLRLKKRQDAGAFIRAAVVVGGTNAGISAAEFTSGCKRRFAFLQLGINRQ